MTVDKAYLRWKMNQLIGMLSRSKQRMKPLPNGYFIKN